MTTPRRDCARRPVRERVRDWHEVYNRQSLLALGFTGPEPDSGVMEQLGLRLDQRRNFDRDDAFGAGPDGIFVAGDAGRGASLVVWAIAEGRATAAAVDRYLMGSSTLPAPVSPGDRPLTA